MQTNQIRPKAPKDFQDKLAHIPELARDLLFQRSIDTIEKANAFISPDYEAHTHDPFLLKDMEESVERIYKAVKNNEKIVIFSDYDADGIPGAVVMHDFLTKISCKNFQIYIPHRHDEGFGLNSEAVEEFAKNNTKLLITVDCGIADTKEVDEANKLGIDVIITDHHIPHEITPKAFAIIDPKQKDCKYPEKMLCGSGVAFKLVQGFLKKYGKEFDVPEGWEKWLLDMVGIATLSDMVPLIGENRVFAVYGLKVLRKTRRIGLNTLLQKLRVKREYLTEDDIGFTISPRINAASRMGIPDDAFKLLSTTDDKEANILADHLDHINNERKGIVASLVKEIRKILAERNTPERKVLVIGNPLWKPALLGLAANSFADELSKPVFLWGKDGDGLIKGSCRSGGSVSVVALMEKASSSFKEFGGHAGAGGFALTQDNIHMLEEKLSKAFEEISSQGDKADTPSTYDASLSLDDINWKTYDAIDMLSPFGVGNPKPVFIFQQSKVFNIKSFGKENNHTEVIFKNSKGQNISAISFFSKPEDWKKLVVGATVDLVAHIEKSVFKNYPELRLRIIDIM